MRFSLVQAYSILEKDNIHWLMQCCCPVQISTFDGHNIIMSVKLIAFAFRANGWMGGRMDGLEEDCDRSVGRSVLYGF